MKIDDDGIVIFFEIIQFHVIEYTIIVDKKCFLGAFCELSTFVWVGLL
jgi:hypothetical protein